MHVKKITNSPTQVTLTFTAGEADLSPIKQQVVQKLGQDVRLSGFRPGKAPQALVEKSIDQSRLQTEVVEEAINQFYVQTAEQQNLRPVARPEISVKKFVPFTTLEFEATVPVVGEVTLPDYKKIKKARAKAEVTSEDIAEVVKSLQQRLAQAKTVERAAKAGDRVTLSFKGVDDKGQPVNGAEGKDYPLALGSNTFIPGFEDNVIGMKAGDEKSFTLTFPKDYGVKALVGKKVTFTVSVSKVEELATAKADDAFAQQAGPFKTLAELKKDIKTQLMAERQNEVDRQFEQELIEGIAAKSKVAIPDSLIDEQLDAAERQERQNLMYRGQTWEEHLKEEGVTEAEHRAKNRVKAEARVKIGLVLSEVADREGIMVTPEELETQLQMLKTQYQDPQMLAELDKPEARGDIANRILTDKTIKKLTEYATKY